MGWNLDAKTKIRGTAADAELRDYSYASAALPGIGMSRNVVADLQSASLRTSGHTDFATANFANSYGDRDHEPGDVSSDCDRDRG